MFIGGDREDCELIFDFFLNYVLALDSIGKKMI